MGIRYKRWSIGRLSYKAPIWIAFGLMGLIAIGIILFIWSIVAFNYLGYDEASLIVMYTFWGGGILSGGSFMALLLFSIEYDL